MLYGDINIILNGYQNIDGKSCMDKWGGGLVRQSETYAVKRVLNWLVSG